MQIALRIDVIEFAGLHETVDDRRTLATAVGSEEQIIASSGADATNGAFCDAVVDLQSTILGVATQGIPAVQRVTKRLGQRGFFLDLREALDHPRMQGFEQRHRVSLTCGQALLAANCRGCDLRSDIDHPCARAPLWRAASPGRRAPRKNVSAHAPCRKSLRRAPPPLASVAGTAARSPHMHRPAACLRSSPDVFADICRANSASTDTRPPADRWTPTPCHREHRSTSDRVWSCRSRERAP